MESKKCHTCSEVKHGSEFYKNKITKDGLSSSCKECSKAYTKRYREEKSKDPEWAHKEAHRSRVKNLKAYHDGRTNRSEFKNTGWYSKNKQKAKAHNASKSLKNDHPKDSELHHWSYRQEHWKDIFPLSKKDHMKIHRYMKYDSERLQYRTIHGTLLDSRELCEKYYNIVLSLKDGEYSELQKLF